MPSHPFVVFCNQVCKSIRWPPAQRLAREELTAHLEDHAAALEEQGVPPEEAAIQAVEAMGDPKEIGQQLNRCHSPFIPRLSQFFAYCACVLFLFGFCIGVLHGTGLFRYDTFLLPASTLPGWDDGELLCEGSAQGGGHVGGYAIQAKDAALVNRPSTKYRPSKLEIQAAVTVSHWKPWGLRYRLLCFGGLHHPGSKLDPVPGRAHPRLPLVYHHPGQARRPVYVRDHPG